jgi:hypothetical protein
MKSADSDARTTAPTHEHTQTLDNEADLLTNLKRTSPDEVFVVDDEQPDPSAPMATTVQTAASIAQPETQPADQAETPAAASDEPEPAVQPTVTQPTEAPTRPTAVATQKPTQVDPWTQRWVRPKWLR